jgi:hypothetical protein
MLPLEVLALRIFCMNDHHNKALRPCDPLLTTFGDDQNEGLQARVNMRLPPHERLFL